MSTLPCPLLFVASFESEDQGAIGAYRLDVEAERLDLVEKTSEISARSF